MIDDSEHEPVSNAPRVNKELYDRIIKHNQRFPNAGFDKMFAHNSAVLNVRIVADDGSDQ